MSVKITGQSGGPTVLSANDDRFGLMTQEPEGAVFHSSEGLEGSNGSTAFGSTFTLACHFTTGGPSGGDLISTVTLCNANAPYKFRILKVRATMLDEGNGRLREAANSCHIAVLGLNDSVASGDISNLRQTESQDLELSRTGGEVITGTTGSLSVVAKIRMGETGVTDTLKILVELACLRVI